MDHAVIDPDQAYEEALGLTKYDDGNTKSNTLYWIATRGINLYQLKLRIIIYLKNTLCNST